MAKLNNGWIVQKGKELYEKKLKELLEPKHQGEYLAIEPETGNYYLGETMSKAYEKAATEYPAKQFYLVRIGSRAAISFKHRTSL